jgi:hypothetical protein
MQGVVSIIGALVVALCSVLLLRAYIRVRKRLLLWSALCFGGLTVSNALAFIDLRVLPVEADLYLHRLIIGAASMLVLVCGLVLDSE